MFRAFRSTWPPQTGPELVWVHAPSGRCLSGWPRAAELVEQLNAYDGDDWYNDVADDYSDIIDADELDSHGYRYTDGTLPLVDGTTITPHDYGKWAHYDD